MTNDFCHRLRLLLLRGAAEAARARRLSLHMLVKTLMTWWFGGGATAAAAAAAAHLAKRRGEETMDY